MSKLDMSGEIPENAIVWRGRIPPNYPVHTIPNKAALNLYIDPKFVHPVADAILERTSSNGAVCCRNKVILHLIELFTGCKDTTKKRTSTGLGVRNRYKKCRGNCYQKVVDHYYSVLEGDIPYTFTQIDNDWERKHVIKKFLQLQEHLYIIINTQNPKYSPRPFFVGFEESVMTFMSRYENML